MRGRCTLDTVRLGVETSSLERTLGKVDGRLVAELESLSVDSLWVGGHVASTNPTPESIVALTRLATMSNKAHVGTSVLLLPLYQPAIIAKQLADLDRACDGRLIVGVGVGGEYPSEFEACGVPLEGRGRRTDEALRLIRQLWTAQPIDHHGEFFDFSGVRIHPPPAQNGGPPLVVAGRRTVAMRRAALLGDGWMPYLYSPSRYAASVAQIHAMAASAGRSLDDFGWYAYVFINCGPDGDLARKQMASWLGGSYRQDFEEMLSHVAVFGTPESVRARLQEFVDSGARHFIAVAAGHPDPVKMYGELAEIVIPSLEIPKPQPTGVYGCFRARQRERCL